MRCTRVLAAVLLAAASSLAAAQARIAACEPAAPRTSDEPVPATAPAAAPAVDASEGKVTHYGQKFAGRRTASGERFDPGAMTMAHKTLPFGTRVKVTNLANQRSVVLRVNDRGPVSPDRIGDISTAAARKLAMLGLGVIRARLEVLGSDVR